jgi:hypothetical protein
MERKTLLGYLLGCCLMVMNVNAGITYVDADLTNTTINGAAPVAGTNYIPTATTDLNNGLWGYRTYAATNGGAVWSSDATNGDETTAPLITTITIANAGTYDLYGHFYGYLYWDSGFSVGSDGPYAYFTKDSAGAVKALASDFEGSVTVGTTIPLYSAYLGTVTTTTANEQVAVYIQGLPSGGVADNRTWYDGIGYAAVPEPATISILGMMSVVALLRRRKA